MAFTPTYGFTANLTAQVSPSAGLLPIDPAVAAAFAVTLGSGFTYVSLSDGVDFEIVQVTSVNGSNLVVVRGQDGTTPSAFPKGSCLRFIWTAEGILAVTGAAPAVTITGSGGTTVTNPSLNHWNIASPIPTIASLDSNVTITGTYPTWHIGITIPPGCC
jgi:hypothetical protein